MFILLQQAVSRYVIVASKANGQKVWKESTVYGILAGKCTGRVCRQTQKKEKRGPGQRTDQKHGANINHLVDRRVGRQAGPGGLRADAAVYRIQVSEQVTGENGVARNTPDVKHISLSEKRDNDVRKVNIVAVLFRVMGADHNDFS